MSRTFQLLLEAPSATSVAAHLAFQRGVLGRLVPRLEGLGPRRLRLAVTEAPPPRLSAVPFVQSAAALFSVEAEDPAPFLEALAPAAREELGASVAGASVAGAWLVDAATPREAPLTWARGSQSPGVGLLSVFRKRRGLDRATFLQRWHGGHTPLTLEVHPVTAYHRCVIQKMLLPGSADLDGIVEERFAERADLVDPRRFYGGTWAMVPNAIRVARDIAGFLDVRAVRSWLVTERRIVEPAQAPLSQTSSA
ncbi:MAG: hypothetical protein AAF447_23575 [Myxococcota bacterium]